MNRNSILVLAILATTLLQSCQKEVSSDDFFKSQNGISVLDLNAGSVLSFQKIAGQGYSIIYNYNKDFTDGDVGSAFVNDYGRLQKASTFGGSGGELILATATDEEDYTYACGYTGSEELTINTKVSHFGAFADAYLCKTNKSGNLVWQQGYSDTANANQGKFADWFESIQVVGDSIFCIGGTENYQNLDPNLNRNFIVFDSWMVAFDKNGNMGSTRLIPSLAYVNLIAGKPSISNKSIKCGNGDIVIFTTASAKYGVPGYYDTTCIISRYNPPSGKFLWSQYFRKNTPEGDVLQMLELQNGDLFCLNSFGSKMIRLNGSTGQVIETKDANLKAENDENDMRYAGQLKLIGQSIYMIGYASIGSTLTFGVSQTSLSEIGLKPWLAKMNEKGVVEFSKLYPIDGGRYVDMLINDNGDFKILGSIQKFNSQVQSGMLVSILSDGTIINE